MILLDTGFLIAVGVKSDQHHDEAMRILKDLASGAYGDSYVSDYIFDEAVTLVAARTNDMKRATKFGEALKESGEFALVKQNIFDRAWELFKAQDNMDRSFTDCTNIAIMEHFGIENIATFDGGFESVDWINVVR